VVEVELAFDASTVVALEGDVVATTATLALITPAGATLQTPVVTLPSVSTTTASGTTSTVLTLVATTGITVGSLLRIVSDGVAYFARAAVVDSTAKTIALVEGLPVVVDDGSAVALVRMTATVTAPGAAAVGGNYRLAWAYDDGTTSKTLGQPAAVVRWLWTPAAGASDVRDVVIELGGGQRSNQWCQDVADRVDAKIRGRIAQTGRRPSLYLSSVVFAEAARAGIRFELAQRGICLGGQVYEAQRELRFAFDDALEAVVAGLAAYDTTADGQIDAAEAAPNHFSIQAVR
jgi:hypothetical protein